MARKGDFCANFPSACVRACACVCVCVCVGVCVGGGIVKTFCLSMSRNPHRSVFAKSYLSNVVVDPGFPRQRSPTPEFATTKLGQGYIFTGVCDSVQGGCLPQCMIPPWQGRPLPGKETPPPEFCGKLH